MASTLTNFITLDTTSLPTTWGGYALSISIDPSLVGQILQIGFSNKATNYEPSGVLYDNIELLSRWFRGHGQRELGPGEVPVSLT